MIVEKVKTYTIGFLDFLRQQSVVGLAIGLMLGNAIANLVRSLINYVVMPPLGFILDSAEGLRDFSIYLGRTSKGNEVFVFYGKFLTDFIDFLIIALVIYIIIYVLGLNKIVQIQKPPFTLTQPPLRS